MSTEGHALAGIVATAGGHLAWCACDVGFWHETEDLARTAWEAHVDRIAATPQIGVDEQGREHIEGDPEQYGREEDQRLEQQLGAWPGASER